MAPPSPGALLEPLEHADLPEDALELHRLLALHRAGLPLARLLVLPAAVEERFYRLNNLPFLLQRLFAQVDHGDPDEDDVEELVPEAQRLLKTHYLLDEVIDAFYSALEPLPPRLRLRRAGTPGVTAAKGRPAILALKAVWADDWTFEAVLERLHKTGRIALEARPILVGPDDEAAEGALKAQVRAILGEATPVFVAPGSGLTRLAG